MPQTQDFDHVSLCMTAETPFSLPCPGFAADPLVGSIAQQLLTDKDGHNKTASEWTRRYAQG